MEKGSKGRRGKEEEGGGMERGVERGDGAGKEPKGGGKEK